MPCFYHFVPADQTANLQLRCVPCKVCQICYWVRMLSNKKDACISNSYKISIAGGLLFCVQDAALCEVMDSISQHNFSTDRDHNIMSSGESYRWESGWQHHSYRFSKTSLITVLGKTTFGSIHLKVCKESYMYLLDLFPISYFIICSFYPSASYFWIKMARSFVCFDSIIFLIFLSNVVVASFLYKLLH